MANDPSFAPPVGELATPSLSPPGVTVDSAGGQGFSLDERGSVPVSTKEGLWRMEFVTVSLDLPNTAGTTGGEMNLTISGLVVGDLCALLGAAAADGRNFYIRPRSQITVANTVTLDFFCMSTTSNPPPVDAYFLVIHRFL